MTPFATTPHGPMPPPDAVRPRAVERRPGRSRRAPGLAVVLAALALGSGCKISKDRVREWAERKDANRLGRVVADGKQSLDVRKEAALALVRIERFYALERALKETAKADRHAITDALANHYLPVLEKPGADEASVVRAKDGLFSAWFFARPERRRAIEEAIARWIVFGPHGSGGDHNIDRILKSFGRRGADLVASLVPADHPNLFVYDKEKVISPSCLLGTFWRTASVEARAATTRRFMKALGADRALALKHQGAVLLSIGALGGHDGVAFLEGLLRRDADVKVRALAVIGLRIAAQKERGVVGNSVRDASQAELMRLMGLLNAGKPLTNPTLRGVSYVEHLFELATLFPGEATFRGLTAFTGAPNPKLADPDLAGIRSFLRLLAVGFLMRHDADRALRMGYEKLPVEDAYPLGYLNQTVLDSAIYVWKNQPKRRPALLKGLRAGLGNASWVAKAIAVEGLALGELTPREGLAQDVAALKALVADKTKLLGDDWRGATLGDRAKKAVEVLGKTK